MSNSNLVELVGLSPFNYGTRTRPITRITPHCIVGSFALERLPLLFDDEYCSCNYAISGDGRVALIVDESMGAWCSSDYDNDDMAVTIECSSGAMEPYTFDNAVYETLANLTADIMRRNGLNSLVYISDKNKALSYNLKPGECLLTLHRWFAAKACPGNWFVEKAPDFARYVNEKLGTEWNAPIPETVSLYKVQVGAFKEEKNAIGFVAKLQLDGYDAFYFKDADSLYKVQIGAFKELSNAEKLASKAKLSGYNVFLVGGN